MFTSLFKKTLPSSRQSMPKTIFVISAHNIARIFLADKYEIQELTPLHTEATDYEYSDKEWFNYVNSGSGSDIWTIAWFHEKNKTHYDHVFADFISKEILKIDKEYQAKRIIIYAPKDLKEILIGSFPKAYSAKLTINIGNHIKASSSKLFELLK